MDPKNPQPPAMAEMQAPSNTCPQCGTELQRKMFRTGSVQHPGKDVAVCPKCGARHDLN